jgi:hypothetical protein
VSTVKQRRRSWLSLASAALALAVARLGLPRTVQSRKEKGMKSCTYRVSLALTVLALLGVAGPGGAQQLDLVPFKATYTVSFQSTPVPVNPPIVSQAVSGAGQADLIGQIAVTAQRTVQLGVDGQPLWSNANPGVFTAANGDTLFWVANGVVGGPGAFIITGGKGRFAGAVGSGTVTLVAADPAKGTSTWSWVGTVSAPKP